MDSDQIVLGVNLDNGQVLHGNAHAAHVAGQALAGEHARGVGNSAHRTCMTCHRASAVALTQTVLAKALDNALVALALGNACNVNLVACCKDVSLQDVANVHCGNVVQTEQTQEPATMQESMPFSRSSVEW